MPTSDMKVLYNTFAPAPLYALFREVAPPWCQVVTLDSADPAEFVEKLATAEVIIVDDPLRSAASDAAPRLRFVQHQGVGYHGRVDLDALRARRIPFAITPEGTSEGVAEHFVLLMLAVARHLPVLDREIRVGHFLEREMRSVSFELLGKTVGFVGMGKIGQAAARRLRPFGVSLLYHDVSPLPAELEATLGLRRAGFDELLAASDVVSLNLPGTEATRHLMNAAAFARMKPGAILINTARGSLVDEAALVQALRSGRLAGAGLDVYETEPLPMGHALLALTNTVLTPHVACGTHDAFRAKMIAIFANVQRLRAGEPLRNQVP